MSRPIRNHLLWILPLFALIAVSLIHQIRRPETLGQRMLALLQNSPLTIRLRGALPLTRISAPALSPTPLSLRRISLSDSNGDTWEGPVFTLHRPHESSLVRAVIKDVAAQQTLERLFFALGYVNQKPHDLVAAAAAHLLLLPDDTLLNALLQADTALLQQFDDPEQVALLSLLLASWDSTSAAAVLELPSGGRLYALETLSSASADFWHLTVLRMDADGAELWHGTLLLARRNTSPPALTVLAQALPQLETPVPPPPSLLQTTGNAQLFVQPLQ